MKAFFIRQFLSFIFKIITFNFNPKRKTIEIQLNLLKVETFLFLLLKYFFSIISFISFVVFNFQILINTLNQKK